MYRYILSVYLIVCSPLIVLAKGDKTVSGEYTYYAPSNLTLDEAKDMALSRAKIKTIEETFGRTISQHNATLVENKNGSTDVHFSSASESDVKGEWVEDIEPPVFKIDYIDGSLVIYVKVFGKVREVEEAYFNIDIKILRNGTDKHFESSEFHSGDDLYLYVKSPTKGYLTVYMVVENEEAFCLLPYMRDKNGFFSIDNNKEYVLFSEKKAESSLKDIVDEYTLTSNGSREHDDIYVIFSPNKFYKANDEQLDENLPRELTFNEFNKWITKNRIHDKEMFVKKCPITIY